MSLKKQIDKSSYEFDRYMPKNRWCSLWHQLDEIQKLKPRHVLEVGPGPGMFKAMAAKMDISIETLDLDPELNPDHVGSADTMPFANDTYDVVCAFQVLEHLPYKISLDAFEEMIRVSSRNIIISLPDAQPVWRYQIHIPKFGPWDFFLPRPQFKTPLHEFDGEHYWELNKRNYSLSKVTNDFTKHARLIRTFRVPENTWHRFFIFEI